MPRSYRFLPPTRMPRSGRSLERAAAVDPPTRPVPPSTSTRPVLEGLLLRCAWAASLEPEGAAAAGAGGAHALTTMPMAPIPVRPVPRRARGGQAYWVAPRPRSDLRTSAAPPPGGTCRTCGRWQPLASRGWEDGAARAIPGVGGLLDHRASWAVTSHVMGLLSWELVVRTLRSLPRFRDVENVPYGGSRRKMGQFKGYRSILVDVRWLSAASTLPESHRVLSRVFLLLRSLL
jgi:hypothetical protein